jgi:hypothetical protein
MSHALIGPSKDGFIRLMLPARAARAAFLLSHLQGTGDYHARNWSAPPWRRMRA